MEILDHHEVGAGSPDGEWDQTRFTLDDLDELAGYVAAEANHAQVKKLEIELRRLYSRIADVLESYTEEPDESAH